MILQKWNNPNFNPTALAGFMGLHWFVELNYKCIYIIYVRCIMNWKRDKSVRNYTHNTMKEWFALVCSTKLQMYLYDQRSMYIINWKRDKCVRKIYWRSEKLIYLSMIVTRKAYQLADLIIFKQFLFNWNANNNKGHNQNQTYLSGL